MVSRYKGLKRVLSVSSYRIAKPETQNYSISLLYEVKQDAFKQKRTESDY